MKKAMSLLIALAIVFSLSATSFAATDDYADAGISRTAWSVGSTDTDPRLDVTAGDLVLSLGTSGGQIVLPETHLKPGTEYDYKIYVVTKTDNNVIPGNVQMRPLTGADLDGGTLRVRSAKGSGVMSNVSIKKRGSGNNATFTLEVETRTNYGTKLTDVEYNLTATGLGKNAIAITSPSTVTFEVGYRAMRDADIDSYDEGDIVTIEQDRPVITRSQFNTLARAYNYKAIEFVDESAEWSFTGRISGMSDTNFVTSYDVIESIVNKLPDQDYKFLTFNAGVTFPTNGEMRIDVSDVSGSFDRIYTYLYHDGSLTPINTSYDSGSDEIVFRTNYLGAFVMTDTEITDTSILEPDVNEPDDNNNNNGNGTTNPDTGARNAANAAAAMGAISLAAAAVVIRKRK